MTPTEPPIKLDYLPEEKVYSVGTLVYNQRQLVNLFIWLMWNDFGLMLMEKISTLNGIQMIDLGATNYQIAVLGSVGGFIAPLINPWVSTWSDRHRGRYGRRRPFLLIATPMFAILTMLIPFMPDFLKYLERFAVMERFFTHIPMDGPAFLIGSCGTVAGLFNVVVLVIFNYLYLDVVPENVMGRFQALSRNVTNLATVVWSFFIYGAAQNHAKAVYVGTGIFTLVVYMVSVCQIKEGEYPPPDPHKKGGSIAPIRAYCVECFSKPYYLWIFVATLFFQLGNLGGFYQFKYLHYDLGLDLPTLGRVEGIGTLLTVGLGLLLGFAVGSMTDRLKAMRLMAPLVLAMALITLSGYYFIIGKWTYFTVYSVKLIVQFAYYVALGAFSVEAFPREKIGQFCSARDVFYQLVCNMSGPAVGLLFDHLHNNRLGFMWMACFWTASALLYVKVYYNWEKRNEHPPVPHAG